MTPGHAPLVLRGDVGRLHITLSFGVRANTPRDEHPGDAALRRPLRSARRWLQRGQLGAGCSIERSRYTGARI